MLQQLEVVIPDDDHTVMDLLFELLPSAYSATHLSPKAQAWGRPSFPFTWVGWFAAQIK